MRTRIASFFEMSPVKVGRRRGWSACAIGLMWAWSAGTAAQYRPPNPGEPLFGEVTRSQSLKFANAGSGDDLLPIEVNGYWGLLNQSGRVIALPGVDWADVGVGGLARFTYDGKTGFMLGNGDWRFDPIYAYADRFEAGFAVFGDGEKFGYLDRAGNVRLEPQLDAALRFREGRAGVRVGGRCGFIDTRFRLTTPLRFTAVRSFHEGFAAVRLPAGQTIEKTDGVSTNQTSPGEARSALPAPPPPPTTREGQARGTWGFLNKNSKLVFHDPAGAIEALGDFNDGLARFQAGGRWGYMNRQFRVVLPPTYEQARDFTQGSAAVKLDGQWGYINRRFEVIVRFVFDQADDFDDTLAMVMLGGKVGFIDRTGRVAIEPQFNWAEPFRLGVARVETDGSFGYLKTSGYVLYDPRRAKAGLVDVTPREQLRAQVSRWQNSNRLLLPPEPRPARPSPYPPEYQYDEGLWVGSPPGPPDPPATPAPPGGPDAEPAQRI